MKFKKIGIIVLAIAMLFSSVSNFVFADETYEDTIQVTKTAVKTDNVPGVMGCITFEITVNITGTPPPNKPVDVVLVIDTSTSMKNPVARINATKTAAKNFADIVLGGGNPNDNRISVVNYGTNASLTQDWTNVLSTVKSSITNLSIGNASYTNIHQGFIFAESRIDAANLTRPESSKVIVMMSDGGANRYMDGNTTKSTSPVTYPTSHNAATMAAYNKGIELWAKANVFTIGLFTGMPNDQLLIATDTLEQSAPAGQFYNSPDTDDLNDIYTEIANLINYSAKDAVLVDKIGDSFELIPPLPAGATYNATTREITWNIGTIGTSAQLKYKLVTNSTFAGGPALTNEYANLTYTDVNGNTGNTLPLPKPEVSADPVVLYFTVSDATILKGTSISLGSGADPSGENYMSPVASLGGDTNFTYEWRKLGDTAVIPGGKNPLVTPLEDTVYELTITNGSGCTGTDTMTVTVTEPKTEVTGTKVWVGGPEAKPSIKLQLFRNNVAHLAPVTLPDGTLSHEWTDLDLTDGDGAPYTYRVDEVDVPENYTKSNSQDGLTVTNTYVSPKTEVTGTKVWVGGPEAKPSIKLQLFRNNVAHLAPVTLPDGTLSHEWTDLDLTDGDGAPYTYRVDEVDVPENYTKSNSQDGLTVTNTYVSPKTEVTGIKVWVGGPEAKPSIKLQLFRNNVAHLAPVTFPDGTLSHNWTDLDLTDGDGAPYTYRVDEVDVPENYTKSNSQDGLTVTNTYVSPKTEVTGTKVWVGGPEAKPSIKLQLFRNNVAHLAPVTLPDGTLSHNWTDLDLTDGDGAPYTYRVDEVDVPENYTKSNSQDGLTVTNTYVSPKTEVTGTKAWVGGPEVKPDIQLQLFRDGEPHLAPVTLSNGTLSHEWTDLDLTDENGVAYEYTVDEVAVPENYTKSNSEDGLIVTNTYVSPKTEVTGSKVWVGGPEVKPDIQLQLFRYGEPHLAPVTLPDGTLSHNWTDLDLTDENGVAYEYTVDEVAVPENYTKSNSEDGLIVTNTYVSPKTEVTGTKVWVGGPEAKPSIKLQLFRNNVAHLAPVTLPDGTLSHNWTDLDLTDENGVAYEYTVDEVAVPENYTKSNSEDGLIVTNTYVSPKTEVTGTKVWVGGPEVKPDIQLQLFRDGEPHLAPVTLPNGTLSHEWTDLDLTDENGVAYEYTVDEVAVPENYIKFNSEDGLTVTNTYYNPDISPQTGDNIPFVATGIGALLLAIGLLFTRKKAKVKVNTK